MPSFREVGLRELSEEDLSYLGELLTRLGIEAPFVGGFVSDEMHVPTRGLILYQGGTWLLRTENIPASASAVAVQYFSRLSKAFSSENLCKVEGTRIITARPFFRTPLFQRGEIENFSSKDQTQYARQVVQIVKRLHHQQLFHGHLSPEDLFLEGGEVRLVDAGITFFSKGDAGRYGSLGDAAHAAQRLDQSKLGDLLTARFPKISVKASMSLLGSAEFLNNLERQLSSSASVKTRDVPVPPSRGKQEGSERSKERKRSPKVPLRKVPSPQRSSKSKRDEAPSGGSWFVPLILILILFGGGAYRYQEELRGFFDQQPTRTFAELRGQWLSGNTAEMIEVAREAVFEDNQDAQRVIVDSLGMPVVAKGVVLAEPLQIAASSQWFSSFQASDRQALFAFALAPLLRGELTAVPDLSSVHPGVPLSLLAGLPEGKNPERLFEIVRAGKGQLPAVYQTAIVAFAEQEGGAEIFRAFLNLSMNRFSLPTLNAFFPLGLDPEEIRIRVQALLPTLDVKEADLIWAHLKRTELGGASASWLESPSVAKWESLSGSERLVLVFGKELPEALNLQQLADLLQAPFVSSEQAGLIERLSSKMQQSGLEDFFRVLASDSSLSRDLVISLVSSLNVKGEATHVFIDKWFETKPRSQTVLELLAALSDSEPFDAFSIPAARYLKANSDWSLSREQLFLLVDHPEPLARGLAYARASIDDPAHKKLLQERLEVETSASLRKLLSAKLNPEVE